MSEPVIIQGGMGVGVSNWRLARAVAKAGQLGVVSGTALDLVLVRRLQLGDLDGNVRRVLNHFPIQSWANAVVEQYFVSGGKSRNQPFKAVPTYSLNPSTALVRLTILGNFVEVFLAKEGHEGVVGINFLEKIQLPTLPSVFGAILGGVDYVLMGAGIPKSIPGILDKLSNWEPVDLRIDVVDAKPGEEFKTDLNPREFGFPPLKLKRPKFLAIISSTVLATALARKSNGRVDGFVVEGATAGGHNAPPRGSLQLNERGEPVYGPKDVPEIDKIRALGLPFWLAGSFADPAKLVEALSLGATGIQVGTAFAFCNESGIQESLKKEVIEKSCFGKAHVYTDPIASPTGFPFKVFEMENSLSEAEIYNQRTRVCDLGYLRHAYRKEDGNVGYRCPGEPVEAYVRKGGNAVETEGRKCVCNGLAATVGFGQLQSNHEEEKVLVTAGDDVVNVKRFLKPGSFSYSALDVIEYLLKDMRHNEVEQHDAFKIASHVST
jgi:nitronate monooxygenase